MKENGRWGQRMDLFSLLTVYIKLIISMWNYIGVFLWNWLKTCRPRKLKTHSSPEHKQSTNFNFDNRHDCLIWERESVSMNIVYFFFKQHTAYTLYSCSFCRKHELAQSMQSDCWVNGSLDLWLPSLFSVFLS